MSQGKDLTRWNRAGLSRFRYVDGKAAEYLELLRQKLVDKFSDPESKRCDWLKPSEKIPANEKIVQGETLIQRQQRLSLKQKRILEMYHQDRRDWAWEISRTFARACHILTEHTNAYANEGYLGTATQWDHVRRLVEMLDYHPAPPASAVTRLVLIAKENKKGTVTKGFQVKNNPPKGEAKVVFETLEDLFIDPALNALRPKGWNQSEDPAALPPEDNESIQPPAEERHFSAIADGPATHLQGVGETWAHRLNTLSGAEAFKIKDFLGLDPEKASDLGIGVNRLKAFKAMATAICNFDLEAGWSEISNWRLSRIAVENPASLAERTGNPLDKIEALQHRMELMGAYLDQTVYEKAKLIDLLAPSTGSTSDGDPDSVSTAWRAKEKPKVAPGQVVMISHIPDNKAEAATIGRIDETNGDIHLLLDQVDGTWTEWPKSEVALHVSPRWKRKCWLNGNDVIRTREPHGLNKGAFISWKISGGWKFAKVSEADKRNLRLEVSGPLPEDGTEIFVARQFEELEDGSAVQAGMEHYGVPSEEMLEALDDAFLEVKTDASDLFTLNEPNTEPPPVGNVPELMPPGKLDFGSFLFPSPFLPIDLVKAAVKMLLSMGIMEIPSTGEKVFKLMSLEEIDAAALDIETKVNEAIGTLGGQWNITDPQEELKKILAPPGEQSLPLYKEISAALAEQLKALDSPLLAIPQDPKVQAVVDAGESIYIFSGSAEKIEGGDWVAGRFTDGLRALKVSSVQELADDPSNGFSLGFENLVGNEGELEMVYADFRDAFIAEGATVNDTSIDKDTIELESLPESLESGRDVLLTAEGKSPVAAKIESVDGNTVKINPSPTGFAKGDLIIRGNVVLAGHGEAKPEKILGSGDAAKSNQEFTLEVDQVSFTPDPTQRSGVAADVDVEVSGRVWKQVPTLKDSTPGDHHYTIRMTEAGYVKFLFGDGYYGRRLPSGKNNIRVRYRYGSGEAGNIPAGSLEKPVKPHPLIKAVHQPFPTAGGADMEDVASLRENAPFSLLALERAVSLSDFSHLAAAQSSVWQARAFSRILHGGRAESVRVVIVPAEGIESREINDAVTAFLQKHALPGVQVVVDNFVKERFSLSVTIRINTDAFIADQVERAVAADLVDHFALRNRKLGEHLYLSEVYKIVEGIQGVESSKCVLNKEKTLQLIRADDERTVIYLDIDGGSTLTVTHEEYRP